MRVPVERHTTHSSSPRGTRSTLAGQERLWFLEQLSPGTPAYHVVRAVRIKGPLEVGALERGLNEIVVRHEILRAAFPARGRRADSRHCAGARSPHSSGRRRLSRTCSARSRKRRIGRSALADGPLIRCRLFRLGAEDHALVVTIHHIVTDDWSMGIFFRELGALYNAFSAGRPSPLPPLTIQFADFADWQRRHLEAGAGRCISTTGNDSFVASVPVLDLPTDRPRDAAHSFNGGQRHASSCPSRCRMR